MRSDIAPALEMPERITAPPAVQDHQHSPLLRLAPELRNRIYHFALIEASPIRINVDHHEHPGLLRVGTKIRNEASGIYMTENTFELECHDMRPNLPAQPLVFWLANVPRGKIDWHVTGTSSWRHLLTWLKFYHEAGRYYLQLRDTPVPPHEHLICMMAFCTVRELKEVEWDAVEAVLEFHRISLTLAGLDWARH
ncbi:hypothetical protein LTR85_008933 [Meristemomyces frigidus]|nr:hypothetical protein LTR85_008933 [Meristemomyces frigidus]